MTKSLIILESPNKVKAVQKFLSSDFKVIASGGHIKDLPSKTLGIDIERNFEPHYVSIPKKTKEIAEIKKCAAEADIVYIATDPDREGEAIAWHIAELIRSSSKKGPKICRIRPNEINKTAFLKELENPSEINQNLCDSQQARRVLDRLVGYQISPILWDKVKRGLSAGRVQSVAVRLIVDRENEIRAHVKKEFWKVQAKLQTDSKATVEAILSSEGKQTIYTDATSVEKYYPKGVIENEARAKDIVARSKATPFVVAEVKKRKQQTAAAPPFTTAELLKVASNRLGFTAKTTAAIAQKLFESVQLEDGPSGIITYIRTDSVRVSDEALKSCREHIQKTYGNDYLPKTAIHYENNKGKSKEKAGKKVQDAHEAIRPTDVSRTPESIKNNLSAEQFKLYQLIWRRFVASQMKPAVSDITNVRIENGDLSYRVSGSVPVFDGYKRVIDDTHERREAAAEDDISGQLPPLVEGEVLNCLDIDASQQFTQPPKRFTEGAFIAELEKQGIGRPSTISPTITNIQSKGYVEKEKTSFFPTELGELVTGLLIESFPDILDVHFTAEMEDKLDKIENGEEAWTETLSAFYIPFAKTLENASETMRNVKGASEATEHKCEKCNSDMVIKWGRNGHFLACSNYPACKNTMEFRREEDGKIIPIEKVIEVSGQCPDCGKDMHVKSGKFGKFLACSGYPGCKHTEPITLDVACPRENCSGKIAQKRSKRGKVFFGCNRYPDCDFVSWNEPTAEQCPNCKESHLEIVRRGKSAKSLCPACAFSKDIED